MILGDSIVAAIARLEVRETEDGPVCNRGTAFLIDASGRVLTARHAVTVPKEQDGKPDPRNIRFITLHFNGAGGCLKGAREDESERNAKPMKAEFVMAAGVADCALLQLVDCARPLPELIVPIPLHAFPVGQGIAAWSTYGHAPFLRKGEGPVDGRVRFAGAREVELQVDGLEGLTRTDVEGLSGSPCLVSGGAIGIITAVALRGEMVLRATLIVVPMTAVAEHLQLTMNLPATRQLPYERRFEAAIEELAPAARSELGEVLRIAGFERIGQDERVRYIARMMLVGGALVTVGAVHACGPYLNKDIRKELIALSLTLWIDGAAAHALGTVLKNGRASAINTSRDDTAKEYVTRACFAAKGGGSPRWQNRCVSVLPPEDEPFVKGYVDKIGERLKAEGFVPPFSADKVIVLLQDHPRSELVAAVAAKYPSLSVIFLAPTSTPDGPRAQNGGVEYIEPELGPADEERALFEREEVSQLSRDL